MHAASLNYCAFCEDLKEHATRFSGEPFVARATFIDITLELLRYTVLMNPQKSRFFCFKTETHLGPSDWPRLLSGITSKKKRALKHEFLCKNHHQGISKVKLRPVKSLILRLWSNPGVGCESRTQGVHAVKLSLTPFLHLERPKRVFQIM